MARRIFWMALPIPPQAAAICGMGRSISCDTPAHPADGCFHLRHGRAHPADGCAHPADGSLHPRWRHTPSPRRAIPSARRKKPSSGRTHPPPGWKSPSPSGNQPVVQTCSPEMEACAGPAQRPTAAAAQNNGVPLLHRGCRVAPCGLTRPTQPPVKRHHPLPMPCPAPFRRSHPHALQRAVFPESDWSPSANRTQPGVPTHPWNRAPASPGWRAVERTHATSSRTSSGTTGWTPGLRGGA